MSGGNGPRVKGAAFEAKVVEWLRDHGHPAAHRLRTPGTEADRGDIGGLGAISVECKNAVRVDLAGWMAQAARAAERNGHVLYACVHKRSGVTDVAESWVSMPLFVFADLIGESQ